MKNKKAQESQWGTLIKVLVIAILLGLGVAGICFLLKRIMGGI